MIYKGNNRGSNEWGPHNHSSEGTAASIVMTLNEAARAIKLFPSLMLLVQIVFI